MRWIGSQTVSGTGTGAVTFSNIPQEYYSLRVLLSGRGRYNNSGNGLSVIVSYNGGAGTTNWRHNFKGDGANPSMDNFSGSHGTVASIPDVTTTSTIYGANLFEFSDYSNTNKNKTCNWWGGYDKNGSGNIVIGNTFMTLSSAITSITFGTDGNWEDGSRFDLYGFASSVATGV